MGHLGKQKGGGPRVTRKMEMMSTKKGNLRGDTGLGTKRRTLVGPVSPPGTTSKQGWRCGAGTQQKGRGWKFRFGNLSPGANNGVTLKAWAPQWARQPGASWWSIGCHLPREGPSGGSRNAGLPWEGGRQDGARTSHPQARTSGQEVGRAPLKPCRRQAGRAWLCQHWH